jgi:Tfp pilus assembly protein PilO
MGQISTEQCDLQAADETSLRINVLEQEVARLQDTTAAFNDQIPVGENLGTFLQDLGRIAEHRQVRLEQIEPGNAVPSDRVFALPVTFKVHGSFKRVFDLIQDIEKMPRLTLIERLETHADRDVSGEVTAQLKLRVYYRAAS